MKKYLLLLVAGLLPLASHACDICSLFMGVTAYDTRHSIALYHRYRVFNGYRHLGQRSFLFPQGASWLGSGWGREGASGALPDAGGGHTHGDDPYDYEIFRVMELRARLFITRRLEATLILPWVNNSSRIDNQTVHTQGLGDVTLLVGYHVIVPKDTAALKQRLVAGAGIKLPSGNYYAQDAEGLRVDNLLQPGSGMTDYLAYVAYTANYRSWVAGLNAQVKASSQNYYGESYAPGYSSNAFVGRQLRLGQKWLLVPQAQAYYEYTQGERLRGDLLNEHQMNNLLGGLGLDVLYRSLQFTAAAQVPLAQHTTDHLGQAGRLTLGFTWNVPGLKPLLR